MLGTLRNTSSREARADPRLARLRARDTAVDKTGNEAAYFFLDLLPFDLPGLDLPPLDFPAGLDLVGAGLAAFVPRPLAFAPFEATFATFFLRFSASADMLACLTACEVSMVAAALLSGNMRLNTFCERAVSCDSTTARRKRVVDRRNATLA